MWRKFAEKRRALGTADTLWFVIDAVLRRLSRGAAKAVKYYLVAQPVDAGGAVTARGSIRLYVAEGVDDVMRQAPRPEATLQSRFAQHSRCVVAERGGELAGFIWWCPQSYREDTVRCDYHWYPAERARWDYDVYVAPPFRMGRLFSRLWQQAHQHLGDERVDWTLSRIDAFNAGSLAAHRKLGAREIGRAWFIVAGRLQLMVATAAPYVHLSLGQRSVPALRLNISDLPPAQDAAP
ncbi:MAG: GNAT family N-acetyltransferase [Piscinibacter sp.]|uniref:GNAT family N-acetyltransferase n=1 Tax=Piscinibacter sp. TaxID=1903157 RepID=UPI0025859FE1|nr:GNAT family N-acetyltransferase [Piscinibacter sp.]MCW5662467.1 GNAT family N-acetyltransferase [Piscinibacter sp.]